MTREAKDRKVAFEGGQCGRMDHHVWQGVPGTNNIVREKVIGEINAGKNKSCHLFYFTIHFILFYFFILVYMYRRLKLFKILTLQELVSSGLENTMSSNTIFHLIMCSSCSYFLLLQTTKKRQYGNVCYIQFSHSQVLHNRLHRITLAA